MEPVETVFLPLPEGIVLQSVHSTVTAIVVQIACRQKSAACPQCEQPSQRVHGCYTRTVADLPCGGRRVLLHSVVRKFVCPTLNCPQQIFTERRFSVRPLLCPHDQPLTRRAGGTRDDHWRRRWRAVGAQAGDARIGSRALAPHAPGGASLPTGSRICLAWMIGPGSGAKPTAPF